MQAFLTPLDFAPARYESPLEVPDCVAFWDFQEAGDAPRVSHSQIALEVRGEVARVEGGVWGTYAARFCGAGHLFAARQNAPELMIGGADSQVCVVAWLKREARPSGCCEFVAGVWNEHSKRQYALFLDLRIHDGFGQIGAHVSRDGRPTPGFKYCMDAAIGATQIPLETWICAAISYDGHSAKTFLNGVLDAREPSEKAGGNPFFYPGALHEGGPDGSDFHVGATPRPDSIDENGIERGSVVANPFFGWLGGLAIYNRALGADEIALLSAMPLSS